ncbi:hypothetical protein SMMN14_01335 [Sphaerulina musiva]
MKFASTLATLTVLAAGVTALDKPLDIKKTHTVECTTKTKVGDKVEMHYRGTLEKDGSEFDASYNRGTPLPFTLGKGQVIKGWDEGLLEMCVGDKRTLTIQPVYGYGDNAMGPIPAKSVLIFETELVSINGKGAETANAEL